MLRLVETAHSVVNLVAASNPLDGVKPDLSPLGGSFQSLWTRLAAAAWAICLAVLALKGMTALAAAGTARRGGDPARYHEEFSSAKTTGVAFGALLLLGVIIGGIISLAGM